MASRAKKGTSVGRPGTPSSQQTPATSSSGAAARSASPLSPTRHSRLAEKAELQNLNDRLACYIDRVRHLETENARLTIELETNEETVTREVTNIKSMYERELSDARKLLDETSREKARLEIDTKRLWEENGELKAKLDRKTKDCAGFENSSRVYETRFNDISLKYNTICQDLKRAEDEIKNLTGENDKLRKQVDQLRKNLESETLSRVDLENNIQSLNEELTFQDNVHSQELKESRSRRQVEITEIDGRLSQKYEDKLQQSLQELRDQYEQQMRANRDEIELLYQQKMKVIQNAANRNSSAAASSIEELRVNKTKIDSLCSRINELEGVKAALSDRIRDLERALGEERVAHQNEVAALEAELSRLRDEMTQQLREYQDLMDIKVSLDLEIAAYDKLLCGEENRLNILPNTSSSQATAASLSASYRSRRTPKRTPTPGPRTIDGATKRRRIVLDESEDRSLSDFFVTSSSKGEIEISEADPEGTFVKLHNKSDKEILIGGWNVIRTVGTNETNFKLHRSVKVEAGGTITIWSSDSGTTHEPPHNIVMKQLKWFVGDNMKTVLNNNDGEEVAASERVKQNVSSHVQRHRSTGRRSFEREEIYHQQVDDSTSQQPQRPSSSAGRSFWLW